MVAWQRFSGKGKGKSKGKEKAKGKGKNKGSNLSFRGSQEASCRAQEPYELPSVRGARTLCRRRHLSQERQERRFHRSHWHAGMWLSEAKHPVSTSPCSMATCYSPGRPCTPRCQRHSGGDTAEGTARCETTTKTHSVSFPHRLHRHLSVAGGFKEYSRRGANATVERFHLCGLRVRNHPV